MVTEKNKEFDKSDVFDEKLVAEARNGNAEALDRLMVCFKPLVKSKAKDYFLSGGDMEDLIQEGMIGLYKAVLDFDAAKNVKFSTFATLCVVRQMQSAIKAASRNKHLPLNTSISIHNETGIGKLADSRTPNPEETVLGQEAYNDIADFIQQNLSPLELDILTHYLSGKTHAQIAAAVGKSSKTVDNAIQRIRRKISERIAT